MISELFLKVEESIHFGISIESGSNFSIPG